MSKAKFKAHASSSRIIPVQNSSSFGSGFGSAGTAFGSGASILSYLAEQPDLSAISESNVIVNFKNLSKKDSTTKAKALEDLQTHVTSLKEPQNDLEDGFLLAWTKVYPRTSIDASRRVRQLAHTLQGRISASIGKRIAKYLPDVVGPWLAGLHDGDKTVSSSTQDSLNLTFATPEKRINLRKAYQSQILDYCRDAALHETPGTLSDERTTTPEDAEAKYHRVVSSSVSLVSDLLLNLSEADLDKNKSSYEEFISTAMLYEHISSTDSTVRRSILRFIKICLQKQQEMYRFIYQMLTSKALILENIATIVGPLLSSRAIENQKGSAIDYTEILLRLSNLNPSIWHQNIKGKSSAAAKLPSIFKHGSYGSSQQFWNNLKNILDQLPEDVLPSDRTTGSKWMNSLQNGIVRKDEPRTNVEDAWICYFRLSDRITAKLPEEERQAFVQDSLFPLLHQYLMPSTETAQWGITGPKSLVIISNLFQNRTIVKICEAQWLKFANELIQIIKTSAPEQSKDFEGSQNTIITQSQRWFALQSKAIESGIPVTFQETIRDTTRSVLSTCTELLKTRDGKPYGAAGALEIAIQNLGATVEQDSSLMETISSFITLNLPKFMFTPSRKHLVAFLYSMPVSPVFDSAWDATISNILDESREDLRTNALLDLLTSQRIPYDFDRPERNSSLQEYFEKLTKQAIITHADLENLPNLFNSPASLLNEETVASIVGQLTKALVENSDPANALKLLQMLVKSNNLSLRARTSHVIGPELLKNLLLLSESADDAIAQTSIELSQDIESMKNTLNGDLGVDAPELGVIFNGLYEANSGSLSIETLAELARKVVYSKSQNGTSSLPNILPDVKIWNESLIPFLDYAIPHCSSITFSLGGIVYLVDEKRESSGVIIQKDRDGYSPPLRMAIYTLRMIQDPKIFGYLDDETKADILRLLQLTIQLVNENLSIRGSNPIWTVSNSIAEDEMMELFSDAQRLILKWLSGRVDELDEYKGKTKTFIHLARERLFSDLKGLTPTSIRNAQAYVALTSELLLLQGWKNTFTFDLELELRSVRASKDVGQLIAFVSAFRIPLSESSYLARICNELVADLTGSNFGGNNDTILRQLITLNAIIQDQENVVDSIAKQRIVFFSRQMVAGLHNTDLHPALQAEACKALSILLPQMNDIYSEQWSQLLDSLVEIPMNLYPMNYRKALSSALALGHAKLKLLTVLRTLNLDEETNDDLKESWQEHLPLLATNLVKTLELSAAVSDDSNQPLRIFNEVLAREITRSPLEHIDNLEDLYPLIISESQPVQKTAFELLHVQIPKIQEQVSVDVALGDTVARLPNELLSLIVEAPTVESIVDEDFHRSIPPVLQGYLSSWLLIFDHFKKASDKLKTDYAANIKDGDYLPGLLDFTFTFLGHSQGKPLDISKFDVTTYSFDIEESPIRDLQWLLTHLYYLCLKRLPSLTKSWWIECKSRSTVVNVESWTEKFISPHIIADTLTTVSEWAATQDPNSDEALLIKANQRAREVTASKEIDDQFLTIAIRLPNNFPLGQATVEPVNRVAIDEKKWRSWRLSTQGVITFSNNSLIDGLIAFRRNVAAALKGQSECAICYSMVSQDKQLPTKKCGTCKNLFHGSCLYRWFKSSNSSSCPLCRNPFNYT